MNSEFTKTQPRIIDHSDKTVYDARQGGPKH